MLGPTGFKHRSLTGVRLLESLMGPSGFKFKISYERRHIHVINNRRGSRTRWCIRGERGDIPRLPGPNVNAGAFYILGFRCKTNRLIVKHPAPSGAYRGRYQQEQPTPHVAPQLAKAISWLN